jgi:very-short-patch-repair endonuclease
VDLTGFVRSRPDNGSHSTYPVKVLGARAPMTVSGSREQRIAEIAAAQRGRITREQMLAAGLSNGAIGRRAASGALRRLHPGVYAVGPPVAVTLADETAALLACGEGALLSHRTAATLWGLLRPGFGPIDVTVVGRQTGRPAGTRVHRTVGLDRPERRVHKQLPVTSAAPTILDIAVDLPARLLEWALDEALLKRLARETEIKRTAAAVGHRGAPIVRKLLADRTTETLTRSMAEERMLELVRRAELPQPEINARLHGFMVDFLWREQGLVLEVDGFTYHSTLSAFERDRRKDATLVAAGFTVIRITRRQLQLEPYAVTARLAQALGPRAPWIAARG